MGHDLLAVLAHNEIPYVLVEKEVCCGMPKLELGDLSSVSDLKDKNIPAMAKLAKAGYAILTPIPSCTLMFKQELPLMFPDDAQVQAVKAAMFDPFEYFVLRSRDGLLKKEYFDNSMKIGRPVFRQLAAAEPDYVSPDCPIAGRHLMQGMGKDAKQAVKAHPLTLLRKAYGI